MKKFEYKGKLLLIGVNYSTKTGKHTCRIEEYNRENPKQGAVM